MTARALTFARAYLARWWHCSQLGHNSYTLRSQHQCLERDQCGYAHVSSRDRIAELGCFDCGAIFWRRVQP